MSKARIYGDGKWARGVGQGPLDPMALSSVLNAEPSSGPSSHTYHRSMEQDLGGVVFGAPDTLASLTRPAMLKAEQVAAIVLPVQSCYRYAELQRDSLPNASAYKIGKKGRSASFSEQKCHVMSKMNTEAETTVTAQERTQEPATTECLARFDSPSKRAPRLKYTDEQSSFIWYHRRDLRDPWDIVVEKYCQKFGEVRHKTGLQSRYYRLLERVEDARSPRTGARTHRKRQGLQVRAAST